MLYAVVLFVCASVCLAQVPQPCMTPQQWEARRFRVDREKKYTEFAKHTYDAVEQRTRTIEEVVVGVQREFYDTLHLHKLRTEYRLNLRTRKCNVTTLDRPFRPVAIPLNANFSFEAELGPAQIPGEHLTIQAWRGKFPDGKAEYFIEVTSPSCDPLGLEVISGDERFSERYFDLVNGIPDPERFIPPTECTTPNH